LEPIDRDGKSLMGIAETTQRPPMSLAKESAVALLAGGFSLALLLGAWSFQYLGGLVPCEMCIWQRWPHAAAIWLGLGGGILGAMRILPRETVKMLAWAAIFAIAVTGAIGIFHAGVEWKLWDGPPACTGSGYVPGQSDDFKFVRCDEAQWRLIGISLAGYNAIFSLAVAALLSFRLMRKPG
jgi:disulfide bond formation protein DsbB